MKYEKENPTFGMMDLSTKESCRKVE